MGNEQSSDDLSVYELQKPSRAPWILTLFALLGAGGAGYLAFTAHKAAGGRDAEWKALEAKLGEAQARLSAGELREKELTSKLETAQDEQRALQSAKDELTKDVESKNEELSKLKGTYDQLQDKLKGELSSGEVRLSEAGGKLRVDLVDKILFGSGDAQISKRGENVLLRIGAVLGTITDKQIQVSGHTDQMPIGEKRAAQFPTNWELSVARATNVVRFLQEKANVPGDHLTASGYSEYRPVASNKTAAGRARNRRIEILLTPMLAPKALSKTKLHTEAKADPPAPAKHADAKSLHPTATASADVRRHRR